MFAMQQGALRHMELTRRKFVTTFMATLFLALTGLRVRTARFVRAVRVRVFPGKVLPMNRAEISKRGKWAR